MSTAQLPPEASRAGKNRYYHECEPVGSSRHYGICLFTIEAFERGQKLMEAPCVNAIKAGTCPALAMREREREAGRALYFVEADPAKAVDRAAAQRERNAVSVDKSHPSYQRGFSGNAWGSKASRSKAGQESSSVKPALEKRTTEQVQFDGASIVNALMNETRTLEIVKQDMLELARPAALRRKKAIEAGGPVKPSVFDYMTPVEKKRLNELKREMVNLKMGAAA